MQDLTDTDLAAFLAHNPDGPVVMLNLLRSQPDAGRERYQQYLDSLAGQASWNAEGQAIGDSRLCTLGSADLGLIEALREDQRPVRLRLRLRGIQKPQ
jgi:hypothetical protein